MYSYISVKIATVLLGKLCITFIILSRGKSVVKNDCVIKSLYSFLCLSAGLSY